MMLSYDLFIFFYRPLNRYYLFVSLNLIFMLLRKNALLGMSQKSSFSCLLKDLAKGFGILEIEVNLIVVCFLSCISAQ